jgi:cytochrome c-type biogenesis protein CcmH
MVASYRNSVRLRPPIDVETALLWSAPVLALAIGFRIVAVSRRRTASPTLPLADEKCTRLGTLLHSSAEHGNVAPGQCEAASTLHRGQMVEMGWNLEARVITDTEREAAVIDLQRRLLTSEDEHEVELRKGTKTSLHIAPAGVPAIALVLYLTNGSPNLPSVTGSLIAEPALPPEAGGRLLANLHAQATLLSADSAEARSTYSTLGRVEADRGDMSAAAAAWNVALNINFGSTLAAATAEALSESVGRVDARAVALYKRTLASAPTDAPWQSMVIQRLAEAKTGRDTSSSSSEAGN